jgi:hypothetical protein
MPPPKGSRKLKLYRQRQSAARTGKHIHTTESRKKISIANSGKNNPMYGVHLNGEKNPFYGKHHTKETREKLSKSQIERFKDESNKLTGENHPMFGKYHSEESRKKMSQRHLGVPHSPEHNASISAALTGIKRSENFCKLISIRMTGESHPFYGKKRPEHSKRMSGENSPFWKGGLSYEPYSPVFNESFKRQIRLDYNGCCFFPSCNEILGDHGRALDVHHYDYNKDSTNCIPLCRLHHAVVNTNREVWQKMFTDRVNLYWGIKWLEQTISVSK